MQRQWSCGWPKWVAALLVLLGYATLVAAQSTEQVEYWRKHYQELRPGDKRVDKAQAIFQRLVQVAGRRAEVMPRLLIIDGNPWEIMLPIALPDGWIVLSSRVLDICDQDSAQGEDRLAFVLAHEIAHQLNRDFVHIRFFQASKAPLPATFVLEDLVARELDADGQGILYAAMAGFHTHAVVTLDLLYVSA